MAVARVQSGVVGTTGNVSATSASATLGSTPTAGNMLVAVVAAGSNGAGTISATNNTGQSWSSMASGTTTSTTWACLITLLSGGTPSTTVQINIANSGVFTFMVTEFSGMGNTPSSDGSNAAQGSSVFQVGSGNITTTNADDLLVQWSWMLGSIGTQTWSGTNPGGSWSSIGVSQNVTGGAVGLESDWQEVLSTGTYSSIGGRVSSSGNPATAIVAIKNINVSSPNHYLSSLGVGM